MNFIEKWISILLVIALRKQEQSIMSVTLSNFKFVKSNFDEFYNIICDIEEHHTSWVDEDYAEEMAELKMQKYYKKKKMDEYQSKLKNKEYLKFRELDLRRKLLHRIGKYELEEGEIFEWMNEWIFRMNFQNVYMYAKTYVCNVIL